MNDRPAPSKMLLNRPLAIATGERHLLTVQHEGKFHVYTDYLVSDEITEQFEFVLSWWVNREIVKTVEDDHLKSDGRLDLLYENVPTSVPLTFSIRRKGERAGVVESLVVQAEEEDDTQEAGTGDGGEPGTTGASPQLGLTSPRPAQPSRSPLQSINAHCASHREENQGESLCGVNFRASRVGKSAARVVRGFVGPLPVDREKHWPQDMYVRRTPLGLVDLCRWVESEDPYNLKEFWESTALLQSCPAPPEHSTLDGLWYYIHQDAEGRRSCRRVAINQAGGTLYIWRAGHPGEWPSLLLGTLREPSSDSAGSKGHEFTLRKPFVEGPSGDARAGAYPGQSGASLTELLRVDTNGQVTLGDAVLHFDSEADELGALPLEGLSKPGQVWLRDALYNGLTSLEEALVLRAFEEYVSLMDIEYPERIVRTLFGDRPPRINVKRSDSKNEVAMWRDEIEKEKITVRGQPYGNLLTRVVPIGGSGWDRLKRHLAQEWNEEWASSLERFLSFFCALAINFKDLLQDPDVSVHNLGFDVSGKSVAVADRVSRWFLERRVQYARTWFLDASAEEYQSMSLYSVILRQNSGLVRFYAEAFFGRQWEDLQPSWGYSAKAYFVRLGVRRAISQGFKGSRSSKDKEAKAREKEWLQLNAEIKGSLGVSGTLAAFQITPRKVSGDGVVQKPPFWVFALVFGAKAEGSVGFSAKVGGSGDDEFQEFKGALSGEKSGGDKENPLLGGWLSKLLNRIDSLLKKGGGGVGKAKDVCPIDIEVGSYLAETPKGDAYPLFAANDFSGGMTSYGGSLKAAGSGAITVGAMSASTSHDRGYKYNGLTFLGNGVALEIGPSEGCQGEEDGSSSTVACSVDGVPVDVQVKTEDNASGERVADVTTVAGEVEASVSASLSFGLGIALGAKATLEDLVHEQKVVFDEQIDGQGEAFFCHYCAFPGPGVERAVQFACARHRTVLVSTGGAVEIRGYADDSGTKKGFDNQGLSQQRADNIAVLFERYAPSVNEQPAALNVVAIGEGVAENAPEGQRSVAHRRCDVNVSGRVVVSAISGEETSVPNV